MTQSGVTLEHVIPVESLYGHLVQLGDRLSEKTILAIIPKLEIAIITKEENKKLVAAGLNSRMPVGWWEVKSKDPLDRYRAAGLIDSIWVDFEHK